MNDYLKFGETYQGLARKIAPYLAEWQSVPLGYSPWWRYTVTVYNKYNGEWYSTMIGGCYFGAVSGDYLTDITVSENHQFVCRIPANTAFTDDYAGASGTFTLYPGDVIVRGAVSDVISDTKGSRMSDLLEKYKGRAFKIKSVSINTAMSTGQHYRAMG